LGIGIQRYRPAIRLPFAAPRRGIKNIINGAGYGFAFVILLVVESPVRTLRQGLAFPGRTVIGKAGWAGIAGIGDAGIGRFVIAAAGGTINGYRAYA
jgi:hypothetical protein